VEITETNAPEGSVVILPKDLILAPTLSDAARGSDTATSLHSALEATIHDAHNRWAGIYLKITSVTFHEGHANVILRGKIVGADDSLHIAALVQILMTVSSDASAQTATVTLDGENIGNPGISHSSEARPADDAYTHPEIEAFIAGDVYSIP